MIITRPNHDFATKYLFRWSQTVITLAKKRNILVIDLKGKRASRVELTKSVRKNTADFIFINGHGNDDLVTGYNNRILVQFNDNEKLFRGRIVYARSCRSAAKLGKSCVKKGTRAYLGYTDDFIFYSDAASKFLGPSNLIAKTLLIGETAGQADQKAKDAYARTIQRFENSSVSEKDRELIPYLQWNMEKQVCLGNKNARLKI